MPADKAMWCARSGKENDPTELRFWTKRGRILVASLTAEIEAFHGIGQGVSQQLNENHSNERLELPSLIVPPTNVARPKSFSAIGIVEFFFTCFGYLFAVLFGLVLIPMPSSASIGGRVHSLFPYTKALPSIDREQDCRHVSEAVMKGGWDCFAASADGKRFLWKELL